MLFLLFDGFHFGKIWKILGKRQFSGRIQPDWENRAWADKARMGSIGLSGDSKDY